MKSNELQWDVRARHHRVSVQLWEITMYPVVGDVYMEEAGIATRLWLPTKLPFDEFWFSLRDGVVAPASVGGEPMPDELIQVLKEMGIRHARRHPLAVR